jgi:ankyrin repeat protein
MPSAASEAAAKRVDDAVRAKDEDALRDAVSKDDTRELGSLAVLRCAETGWIEGLRTAVEAGAIYRCKTASGASPAHLAAMGGHDILHVILDLDKSAVNAVNAQKQTPLHFAAVGGNALAVSALVRNGADVNTATSDGSTALHYACGKCATLAESERPMDGWERCVHVLLDNGADPFARDSKGKTPGDRLPKDARAKGVLEDFMRKKEAAAAAVAEALCAEPETQAPAPKQRKARRRKPAPRAASPVVAPSSDSDPGSETSGAASGEMAAAVDRARHFHQHELPALQARARAASLADDATPWSTVVRRRGAAPPPAPAAPPLKPPPTPPRDVNELFAALFPAAPALALRAEHLLLPSEDLSPSQLEAVHDILDACTRRVIDARIAVAARARSDVVASTA